MKIFQKRFLLLSLILALVLAQSGPADAFECTSCPSGAWQECEEADPPVDFTCPPQNNACSIRISQKDKTSRGCTGTGVPACKDQKACTCIEEKCNANLKKCQDSCATAGPGPGPVGPPGSGTASPPGAPPPGSSGHLIVPACGVIGILSVVGAGFSSGFWKLR